MTSLRTLRHPRRLAAGLLLLAGVLPSAVAQEVGTADQVYARRRAGEEVEVTSGIVITNSLAEVVIESDDRSRTFDSALVEFVIFGSVPDAYREAEASLAGGDHENAARQFAAVAGDPEAREVVRAEARLLAARSLLQLGASSPDAFGRALEEVNRYLEQHPDDRLVPEGHMLAARATHLSGDPAGAAELYHALYLEGVGTPLTTGYDLVTCYEAGLRGAAAFLDAGDTLRAREIYASIESTLPARIDELDEASPDARALRRIHAQARAGEGRCLLAGGSVLEARTFYSGLASSSNGSSSQTLRMAAEIGLADCAFAQELFRDAQIRYATVAAVDYTDRDRIARALVGLARSTLSLDDSTARQEARKALESVLRDYGDTPAVLAAREMLQGL